MGATRPLVAVLEHCSVLALVAKFISLGGGVGRETVGFVLFCLAFNVFFFLLLCWGKIRGSEIATALQLLGSFVEPRRKPATDPCSFKAQALAGVFFLAWWDLCPWELSHPYTMTGG